MGPELGGTKNAALTEAAMLQPNKKQNDYICLLSQSNRRDVWKVDPHLEAAPAKQILSSWQDYASQDFMNVKTQTGRQLQQRVN